MSDYILGSDTVLDLEDIWEYIAADSIDAADQWIAKLFDAFETIAGMPGIGHSRKDLTAFPVLFWTVGAYLIIYRSDRRPIEIVAVTQGSRDIASFLRQTSLTIPQPSGLRPIDALSNPARDENSIVHINILFS